MGQNNINRQYKDSVFVDLFSRDKNAKANFLSLYNALHGTDLPLSCPVEQLRLDNVMYLGIVNDVSCLVDNKIIVLAEHQSTINENMPLRCLEYIARLYEKLQDPKSRYRKALQKIPTPEFYVFYNGKEDYPNETELHLSDAFIDKQDKVQLELTVHVLNINKDKNTEVLSRCKTLDEYSVFVEEVRVQTQKNAENGFTNAVKSCIKKGVLKDYLERKSTEVISMLIAEYDYDTDIAVQREEAVLAGMAEGMARGMEQGIKRGMAQGMERGFSDGVRQKALETAIALKRMGLSLEQIVQATGLSIEEIEKI